MIEIPRGEIAPLEPRVSVCGRRSWSARKPATSCRVPEPLSRISQTRLPSSSGRTGRSVASGSSGAVISASSLGRNARPAMRSSSGGRPAIATSTSCSSTRSKTESRFATSSVRLISGCEVVKARSSEGTTNSAAVATATMRSERIETSAASRAAFLPCSISPRTSAAYGRNAVPAAVSPTPRPTRSVSSTPSSFERAETAAEIDGCVT